MEGKMTSPASLPGALLPSANLTGEMSVPPDIKGKMTSPASLSGTLSTPANLTGKLSAPAKLEGKITIPTAIEKETYGGDYEVTPLANSSVVLETSGKLMTDDVTVLQVPYYQTSNEYGDTVYIASEV